MSQNGESHQKEVCPNCGYCPVCGRGNPVFIPAPGVIHMSPSNTPGYPWGGFPGTIVTC